MNYTKKVTIFAANFWKVIAIRDPWWLNSRPEYSHKFTKGKENFLEKDTCYN